MTIEDAVKLVNEKYLDNKPKRWIHDPVAYTLYEVWKIVDSKEVYSPSYATVEIHPCKGCEDYIEPNDCKSRGGCGKPTTNADRIRSMSDEELSSWLNRLDIDCPDGVASCVNPIDCVKCWLDWLKSPAGGEQDAETDG